MSTIFSRYIEVLNKICLAYTGNLPEYVVQLDYIRSVVEQMYPELEVWLACRPEFSSLARNHNLIIDYDEKKEKHNFVHVATFKVDPKGMHPVESFLQESGLTFPRLIPEKKSNLILICPDAGYPSFSLSFQQVDKIKRKFYGNVLILGSNLHPGNVPVDCYLNHHEKLPLIKQAGLVIGAENEFVFAAASLGIPTYLVPSGRGTRLFQIMFPYAEILNV